MAKDKKSFLHKLVADINAYLNGEEITAELVLQDVTGTEIKFANLEEDSTPAVGDKATIDGAKIPDGSYEIPGLENSTLVFEDGAITEIKPKEEEPEETEVKAETEGLEISTWSLRLVNDTFAVGDKVEYYDWEEEVRSVSAAEIAIPTGQTIVTDAAGIIVKIKEAPVETPNPSGDTETPTAGAEATAEDPEEEPEVSAEVDFEALLEKITEKVTAKVTEKITAEFKSQLEGKDELIKSLQAKIGGKEFTAEDKEPPQQKKKEKGAARYLKAARNL